jgi:hypothetical protein
MNRSKSRATIAVAAGISCLISVSGHADCAPPADGPPMCLVGTITSPGYDAALIELAGSPGVETVKPNGELLDWRVLKILPRAVLLGQHDKQVQLALGDPIDEPAAPAAIADAAIAPSESIAARSQRLRLIRKQQRQN